MGDSIKGYYDILNFIIILLNKTILGRKLLYIYDYKDLSKLKFTNNLS